LPLAAALASSGGCHLLRRQAAAPTPAPVVTPKPGPQPPKIDYAAVRPNELGYIPVIMYHEVREKADKPLTRSIAEFKKDLDLLYDAGFRPVNLGDVVNDNIDVPAGKSPVVLTFDDARPSQFQLTETPTQLKIDPNCAVGILEAFHKEHPDWKMRATFFVLPKSRVTMEPFGQLGLGTEKMEWLLQQGMEIGNHTTTHRDMSRMSPAQIQEEIGNANNAILAAVPKAKIQVMAVPMSKFPRDKKNWQYLIRGTYQGTPYAYKAAFAAAWRPIPSPDAKNFKPLKLERIDSVNGLNGIRDWITKLTTTGSGYQRYISDGDPNVISYPKGDAGLVNGAKVKEAGKLAYAYSPFGGVGGEKPIVGAEPETTPAAGAGERAVDTTPPGNKKIITPAAEAPPSGADATPAASAKATITEKPIGGAGG
jgi:peptidoglycan/xylan/chitin deacetylase (PgdA/CDA1 family)